MNRIVIDQEFKNLISPLGEDEYKQLEENILRDECRDPLVVWQETNILLDGHHRYAICTEHGRTYQVVALSFEDRLAASEWALKNQLGRRNLSPEVIAYLRGKLYKTRRQQSGKRNDLTSPGMRERLTTSQTLAKEHGVGHTTIESDAAFATAVDLIAESAGQEAKQFILSGQSGLTRPRIKQLSIEAPDKARFEIEVLKQLHQIEEATDDGLKSEQIEEANRATRVMQKSRTMKTLGAVARLARSFAQFSSFILKFRGAESADEAIADWNRRQAKWLYEEVDSVTREMHSWQIALEQRFPDLREHNTRLKAVN